LRHPVCVQAGLEIKLVSGSRAASRAALQFGKDGRFIKITITHGITPFQTVLHNHTIKKTV
jgi:hypothetical protein